MSLITVGVLRGGPTSEYDVSLKTGQYVLHMLSSEPLSTQYKGVDIFIDKEGVWHIDGIPAKPEQVMQRVDVLFNATKGSFEKGEPLHRILNAFKIPCTGTHGFASTVASHKSLSKKHFKEHGIKTPYYKELKLSHDQDIQPVALDLFRSFPMPVIVKPVGQGSSLGVSFASNFDELLEALKHARAYSEEVLVEEYLTGKEIISGFIDDFRGKDLYHMFPVEVKPHTDSLSSVLENPTTRDSVTSNRTSLEAIRPSLSDIKADMSTTETTLEQLSPEEQDIAKKLIEQKAEETNTRLELAGLGTDEMTQMLPKKRRHSIFNWIAKHAGLYDHTAPAQITQDEKKIIEEAVQKIKHTLGLRHYATADFIVHPKRGVYLLEINTDPSLHEHSPIYKSLEAGGVKHHEFLDHILRLALGQKK